MPITKYKAQSIVADRVKAYDPDARKLTRPVAAVRITKDIFFAHILCTR
jgi:hypothetical protein